MTRSLYETERLTSIRTMKPYQPKWHETDTGARVIIFGAILFTALVIGLQTAGVL